MAFSIYQFVPVASQSRSWLTMRLTSDANNFVNAKTMPEKNLNAQGMFWRTSSKIKQNKGLSINLLSLKTSDSL